tara:strand:+ start:5906 stop:7036 length:1131 start_codon:yes stop_codon:yes gene_type:complete
MILKIYFLALVLLLITTVFLPKGKFLILKTNLAQPDLEKDFYWNPKLLFILFLFGLFAALRDTSIGTDYPAYTEFYEHILNNGKFQSGQLLGIEPGWHYVNLFFGKLGIPSSIFFGLVTVFTWAFFIKGSYNFQHLLPLMFFFVLSTGFFFWTLSGLRQSISIMIFFYAIKFLKENNLFRYVISITFASFFHISIILMLPYYFLRNLKYNRNVSIALFVISLGFVGENLFIPIVENALLSLGSTDYLLSYIGYLEEVEKMEIVEKTGTNLGFLLTTIFTIFILLRGEKTLQRYPEFNIYYVLFVFYAILNNIFFGVGVISRLFLYCYICFPVVAAIHTYSSRSIFEKLVSLSFLLAFGLFYLVTAYKFLLISLTHI